MKRKADSELVVVSTGGNSVSFEKEGESVEGIFDKMEKGVGKNESNLFHFVDDKGKEFSIWGSANLDPILSVAKKGDRIRVTYQGKKKTSAGYKVKTFEVAGSPAFAERAIKAKTERIAQYKGSKGSKSRKSR